MAVTLADSPGEGEEATVANKVAGGGNHQRIQPQIDRGQDAVTWLHDSMLVDMARWLETSASGDVINVDALVTAFAYDCNNVCDISAGVDARCGGGR